jgi:hypothetical protein
MDAELYSTAGNHNREITTFRLSSIQILQRPCSLIPSSPRIDLVWLYFLTQYVENCILATGIQLKIQNFEPLFSDFFYIIRL